MSDFAGQEYDFAAGSLKGLRGWNMDKLGRLHGVTHEEVWRPGENVSVCKKEATIPCPAINRREEARKASEAGRAQVEKKKGKKDKKGGDAPRQWYHLEVNTGDYWPRVPCSDPTCVRGEHHIVPSNHRFDPSCDCGFWAYDEAGFKAHGRIVGVIEGYGKTTVGTKGFRCEKARILALSCENGEGVRHSQSVLMRLMTLYPEVALFDTIDALIDAHPETLRTWPEVGEDFWLQPVEPKREGYVSWTGGLTLPASSSFTFYPSASGYSLGGSI